MHASTEQLLSLRDGAPCEAAVAAHVNGCALCKTELAALAERRAALAALPDLTPPDAWPAIAARLASRRRRWRRPGVAVAAVAMAGLGLAWLAGQDHDATPPQARPAATAEPAATDAAAAERAAVAARLDELQARSAQLEQRLRTLKARAPAVMRLGHEANAMRLQAHLRALDAGRAQWRGEDADLERLYWHERVRLLDSLVDVEQAERLQRAAAPYRVVPAANRQ